MKSYRSWIFVLCFYLGILSTLSLAVYTGIIPPKIIKFKPIDLTGHFILIGFISYIAHLSIKKYKLNFFEISLPLAPIVIFFLCSIDEITEKFTWHQGIDEFDLLADLFGITFFTWLAERTTAETVDKNKQKNK
ncbi:VanZ family protein [Scytonema sp. NUACC21]